MDPVVTPASLEQPVSPSPQLLDPLPPILSARTLNLLAGASGVGKTAFIAWLLKHFQDQTPIFGRKPNPIPGIGYIGADRPWTGDTERWFAKVGLTDIAHYSLVEDRSFDTARFLSAKPKTAALIFKEHLSLLKLPPGSLVVVDPIAIYIGADMNHYIRCAMGCINLYRVVQEMGLTIIGVDHSSKQKGDSDTRYTRLQDRIGGSMAKLGYTATQMYLAGPEEMASKHHTFLWNPHHAPRETFDLQQDPTTGIFSLVNPPADDEKHHQTVAPQKDFSLSVTQQALLVLIPVAPDSISTASLVALYTDAGSRATLFRHLSTLEEHGYVIQPKHGLWSRISLDGPQDPLPGPPPHAP